MCVQILCDFLSVVAVAFHAQRKGFQTEVEQEAVCRGRNGAKVTHKLRSCFCDVGFFSELFRVDNTVIGFIRFSQAVIFMSIGIPIKVTAVNNGTADLYGMSVHIFGCGMGNDISTPFKRTAVDWCGEGVVYDKRNFVFVSNFGKFFDIQDYQSRVCNGFCEKDFCVWTECSGNFLRACIGVNKSTVNAEFFEGNGEKVEGSTIDSGSCDYVVTCLADIKNSVEVGCLSGRSKNCGNTALQISDFGCYGIICRVLKAGVEVSFCFQIKKLSHFISSIIFISGTLINRECTWFPLGRSVTGMETFSLDFKVTHEIGSFLYVKIN